MYLTKVVKKLCCQIKKLCVRVVSLLFYLFPIKRNRITVYNFMGNGYGDNPKYLVEELLKHGDYEIVWIVRDINVEMPKRIKKVRYNSLKSYYYMTTARLWLDTIRNNPKPIFKRKGQYYIQMWHGGFLLKGVEKDIEQNLNKGYVRDAKRDSKFADFFLSNCKDRTNLIKRAFWFKGEILEFGLPRNDVLFKPRIEEINKLKAKYKIVNKKIVLYAPSFRENNEFYDTIGFDYNKLVQVLNAKFNGDFVFCVRLHPNDLVRKNLNAFKDAINLTSEPDSRLVLSASDVIISDYSSMLIDFALTGRYAFILAPDYEEYIKRERYLYLNIKTCGIPFANNFGDLVYNIENLSGDDYRNNINKLFEHFGIFEHGNASEQIVNELLKRGILKR